MSTLHEKSNNQTRVYIYIRKTKNKGTLVFHLRFFLFYIKHIKDKESK